MYAERDFLLCLPGAGASGPEMGEPGAHGVFFKEEENDRDDQKGKDGGRESPPMMTHDMELRVSEPAVTASAVGSMPTIMVKVVMRIGRRRSRPASITASFALIP